MLLLCITVKTKSVFMENELNGISFNRGVEPLLSSNHDHTKRLRLAVFMSVLCLGEPLGSSPSGTCTVSSDLSLSPRLGAR